MQTKSALREAGASVSKFSNPYNIHAIYVGYNRHDYALVIAPCPPHKLAEFRQSYNGNLIEAYTPEDALAAIGANVEEV